MTTGADAPEDREYANWFLSLGDREQHLVTRQLERVRRETLATAGTPDLTLKEIDRIELKWGHLEPTVREVCAAARAWVKSVERRRRAFGKEAAEEMVAACIPAGEADVIIQDGRAYRAAPTSPAGEAERCPRCDGKGFIRWMRLGDRLTFSPCPTCSPASPAGEAEQEETRRAEPSGRSALNESLTTAKADNSARFTKGLEAAGEVEREWEGWQECPECGIRMGPRKFPDEHYDAPASPARTEGDLITRLREWDAAEWNDYPLALLSEAADALAASQVVIKGFENSMNALIQRAADRDASQKDFQYALDGQDKLRAEVERLKHNQGNLKEDMKTIVALRADNDRLREALEAVVSVADRRTVEFDLARAALKPKDKP